MANRHWKFEVDGSITDGVNSVKFNELTKYNTTTKRVETIGGEAIQISVTDSDKLGGEAKTSFLMKSELSVNGKGILSGNIDYNSADMEEVVSQALTSYIGGGLHPTVPMVGMELIPNTTFANSNNVIVENAANVAVNNNKLRITKSTIDNPIVYETVALEANKVYRVKVARYIIGANVTTRLSVTNSSNVEIIGKTCTTDELLIDLGFSITEAGNYKVKLITYTTTANIGCEYYLFSCRQINIDALEYGQYVTYKDNLMYTEVVTNINSQPLTYDPTKAYSNAMYNNLAFFLDSFDLLQYVSPTPALSGFIKDASGVDVEYMKDINGKWIGDFKSLTAGELTSYINLFGSGSKTVDGTTGLLTIQRTAIDNVTPTLKASINYTGVKAGGYYFISFYIEDIDGEWYADIYSGTTTVRYFLSGYSPAGGFYKNTLIENRTVRLIVKSYGLPCAVNILRDNILNNPIALTDKISIKNLSVKALDASVWKVHTPDNKMESSPMLNWNSSDVMFMPNIDALPVNGSDDNSVRFTHSILGNGTLQGATSNLANIKAMVGNLQNALHDGGESIKFTNRGIKIYYSGLSGCNLTNKNYSLLQTAYNKVRIYIDEHGKKQLIVSDPISGVSTTLFQVAIDSTKRLKQDVKHDLLEQPSVSMLSLINKPVVTNPWAGYQVYVRTNKEQDSKALVNTSAKNDIVHCTHMLNSNTTTTCGINHTTLWAHLRKEDITIAIPTGNYTTMEYGLCIAKNFVENENRISLIYKGTNSARLIKTNFKPNLMLNCNMNNSKVKRTQIVNSEFGKDKFYNLDGAIVAYAKPANAVVSLLDTGVALLEYNTSTTDGNAGCIEKFNAAPLPGTVGNDFWYHAFILGNQTGSKFTTVKRPKPTAKLNINNLLISTVTTTNEVVGNKYTTVKTNKIVGE